MIRARHYSRRTEEAYVHWIRRFVLFHGRRHPREMGAAQVTAFLSSLANDGHVAAATQNQALAAILFLYRAVLAIELPWMGEIVRAKRPRRLPVVTFPAAPAGATQRPETASWPTRASQPSSVKRNTPGCPSWATSTTPGPTPRAVTPGWSWRTRPGV